MAAFSISALAIADEHADAIGAVRLTCFPDRLWIELIYAAPFRFGFAPAGVAKERTLAVPYTAIRGLFRKGRMLCLSIDPSLGTPFHRFALVRFTTDPAELLAGTFWMRALVSALWYGLPLPLGYLAARAVPSDLLLGTLGFAAFALVAAALVFWLFGALYRFLTWGGPSSDACRDAFEAEISRHLGLPPVRALGGDTAPQALDGAETLGSRPIPLHWGMAIASAGALVLLTPLAIFLVRRYTQPSQAAPERPELFTGLSGDIQRLAALDWRPRPPPPPAPRPRCVCERAQVPLWKDGIPRLSVFMSANAEDGSGKIEPVVSSDEPPYFEFDLAVVNNTEKPMRDVRVVITFARRNQKNERVGVTDRGFFWEGRFSPGRAIKWHVKAPGTEMRVDVSETGTLQESGEAPAPPDSFYELLSARYRIVKIHGAMMLSYLRDPRAEEALIRLGPPASGEALVLDAIRRANASVFACDMKVVDGGLSLCVLNAGSKPGVGLWAKSAAAGGQAAFEAPIGGALPVHEGERVWLPYPGEAPPDEVVIEAQRQTPGGGEKAPP